MPEDPPTPTPKADPSLLSSNALGETDSPYLRQHAGNPVHWQPWGEAAFTRARAEGKPVFLSVGYSTCHWCHVMARESFADEATARLLNQHFISIKVDREERPDVDLTYMTYVQATTGHGGWPMSVWLTPDGHPFLGGTYFPPEERHGMPGFKQVLAEIATVWATRRGELEANAAEGVARLDQHHAARTSAGPNQILDANRVLNAALKAFVEDFDSEHGGFGGAPKFPRPVALSCLLALAPRVGREEGVRARQMVVDTLRAMVRGGIHDHLGGGFHRYAVDRIWHIPHYEKMLYDQAQLATLYVEAGTALGQSRFHEVARGIFAYVRRDLRHPDGGFFAAEDADSLPTAGAPAKREGAFYVFAADEIRKVLGEPDAALFAKAYGVEEPGNAAAASDPHGELTGTNTLFRAADDRALADAFSMDPGLVEQRLHDAREKLLAYRSTRPRPHRDEKIIAAWNGLMIGAFARGGMRLGDGSLTRTAEEAAAFIRERLWDAEGKRLFRTVLDGAPSVPGFAVDYACLIEGLLDLHDATFDTTWLQCALDLQAAMDRDHLDPGDGRYFSARADGGLGILSIKEDNDGAEPAPDSTAASNLVRLARLTHDGRFEEKTRRLLVTQAEALHQAGRALPRLVEAFDLFHRPATQAVVAPCDGLEAAALAGELRRHAPRQAVLAGIPGEGPQRKWWIDHDPFFAGFPGEGDPPALTVCHGTSCGAPVHRPGQVGEAIRKAIGPPRG